jgi:CzcA family heavy metal efflux pump
VTLSKWAQSHHKSILFVLAAFALAGLLGSFNMPVSLFPRVNFPRVVVNLNAGDRPVERMAIEVTWPIEEAVRSLPGVRSVRSTTSRGSADISVNFDWGLDMVSATLQVESAVNQAIISLPAKTTFQVRRMDPTVFPILGYSLTSDSQSLVQLKDLALYTIRPILSSLPGIARVEVLGGASEEYQVTLDPARLASFGLNLSDVAKALSASNVIQAVGKLEENYKLYLILSNTQFENFDQIAQTILRSGVQGIILLEDVGVVSKGTQPQWVRVTADAQDAVLLNIYQQPGGNTVAIAKAVQEKLGPLIKQFPADVSLANWYDQSELIVKSALGVRDVLLIGLGLAILVLILFLRNFKVTLIAAVTVPIVLATTLLVLQQLGMGINIMSLGGMAAAVGLIIDDAIVMIEHIIRRIQDGSGSHEDRVHAAVSEFTPPLAGSSASTIIIFVPLAFLTGITGAFFRALSLTVAVALIISFFVVWLVVPLLSLRLLKEKDTELEKIGGFTKACHQFYGSVMQRILPQPWLILLIIVPLLSLGFFAYQRVGTGFMPSMDEGGFILDYRARSGTSLSETDRLLRQIENILQDTPEVQTFSRRTGLSLGGHITESNEGDFFIRLKPFPRRGLDSIMDDIRNRVEHNVPGVEIELAKLMEDLIGDLTAVPQPIEIKLFSDDGPLLEIFAQKVALYIEQVPGVVDVNNGIVLSGDALDIQIDRTLAALEGITPDEVTQALNGFLYGIVSTGVQRGPKMIGVRVRIPIKKRATASDIKKLRLRAPDGHWVSLDRIANFKTINGQPQIQRDNLKRMIAVTGRISGRDLGSTLHDIVTQLDSPGFLGNRVSYALGGLYEQQRIAFRGMAQVFAAAIILVFALLLFLYEQFRVAIAMLTTTLLSVAAVFIGLLMTGIELNITAMMGLTMVIGIVTEVGIFYYSEYHSLAKDISVHQRLIRAGQNRMRPITMTTLAAILALSPLSMGIGEGSAILQPLAIAIISGLMVQVPLSLFVLPLLLVAFQNWDARG